MSKARLLSKLMGAGASGRIATDNIPALDYVGQCLGYDSYGAISIISSPSTGDQAFNTDSNALYMWNGTSWIKVSLINNNPNITGGYSSSYTFAKDGTPIVITLVGSDPEGIPLTWSYEVTSGSLTNGGGTTATVAQNENVFTITPTTTEAYEGSFTITFKASDGINIGTAVSSFSLIFGLSFSDDFSTNTLSNYTIVSGSAVNETYDAANQLINVGGGDNYAGYIWYDAGATNLPSEGTFRMRVLKTADYPSDNDVNWIIGNTPATWNTNPNTTQAIENYSFAILYNLKGSAYTNNPPSIIVNGSVVETHGTTPTYHYDDQSAYHTFELYWNTSTKTISFYIDESLNSTHTFTTAFQSMNGFGWHASQMSYKLTEWSVQAGPPTWL